MSVPLYHFLARTTDRIDMKFYMHLSYIKAQTTKQDWVGYFCTYYV